MNQIAQIFGTEQEPNPSGGRVYDAAGGHCDADTRSGSRNEPAIHSATGRIITEPVGIIDPQGRIKKTVELKSIAPTLRAQVHGNIPEVVLKLL